MDRIDERRRLLGAFLRARRERLAPADAGIHGDFRRRRTPGLRREEVAQLSGLSPTWYSWMEQGRDVSVSPQALARVADALHLTPAERTYVFELAEKRDPNAAADEARGEQPPSPLLAAIAAMTAPAYLLDRAWRARGWNPPAERLFEGWLGGGEPNLLRYVFLDAGARTLICDWEHRARRLLAEFRADTSRYGDDGEIVALVRELKRASPEFARLWDDHGVLAREGGGRTFNHPRDGMLQFEQLTLKPAVAAGYKLVMLLPAEKDVSHARSQSASERTAAVTGRPPPER